MTNDDVRADPLELAGLAMWMLAAAAQLGDGWRGVRDLPDLPATALGDPGAPLIEAHGAAADAAAAAVDRLTAVLESDVDAVLGTAFAYRVADDAAAARLRSAW